MLGVILDIDSMDEGEFVILFSAQRDNAYRWIRLLQIARRANWELANGFEAPYLERAGLLEFFHEATS